MGLKLAGETGVGERVERVVYTPGVVTSGDLEPGTRTVTATAKPGVADYTASLTIPSPPSPLGLDAVGLRLAVTIDSFGGSPAATRLNYAVEVNGVERLTGFWSATGSQVAATNLRSGEYGVGAATSIAVFLWVDQGNAVVSLSQVWMGVGSRGTDFSVPTALKVNYSGRAALCAFALRVGTGTPSLQVNAADYYTLFYQQASGEYTTLSLDRVVYNPEVRVWGSVTTDLNYLHRIEVLLLRLD